MHSSFKNQEVINLINSLRNNVEMVINDKLLDKLSNKENCYVAAIFNKYSMNLNKNNKHLVLVNPMNMGNFGTIIRSALGFGFTDIAVIKPAIDIFDPKVIRSAMGSFFSCNIKYFNTIEEYNNELFSLVFGNESSGLPISYLNDDSIIISHSNKIDSLNLPMAVTIALYEVNKQIK